MHVTLIQLHDGYQDNSVRYPLGLSYLAANLRDAGHTVNVIDFKSFFHSDAEITAKLKGVKADLIGLSGLISAYHYLKDIVKQLRSYHPDMPLILGGPLGFTIEPLLLKHNDLDAICTGEGEQTIVELAEAVAAGRDFSQITGLWLPDGQGGAYSTGLRTQVDNLDDLPFPAWEILDPDIYRIDPWSGEPRSMSILASRGCPSSCDFCAHVVLERSIRYRSVENVIQEIRTLRYTYGIRHFTFVDEYFTADMRWVKVMCQRLIDEGIDIEWNASSRVRIFDDETYDLLKASGCGCLSYGVESANQVILKSYGKRQKPDDTLTIFRKINARGMRMNYLLISGAFQESPETMDETMRILLPNGNQARFFFLTPLPGTPIYRQAMEKGLFTDEDNYLTLLSTTDTTFVRTPTLKLTDMPLDEWLALKLRCEQDSAAMMELRNRVGVFGQYLWRVLAAVPSLEQLSGFLPQLQTVWRAVQERVAHFNHAYPALRIDLGSFKQMGPDPETTLPLPPMLLSATAPLAEHFENSDLLHWLWQRYGLFGEKLLAHLLVLSESSWQHPTGPQVYEAARQVLLRDLGLISHALSNHPDFLAEIDAQPMPVVTPPGLEDPLNWQVLIEQLDPSAALSL